MVKLLVERGGKDGAARRARCIASCHTSSQESRVRCYYYYCRYCNVKLVASRAAQPQSTAQQSPAGPAAKNAAALLPQHPRPQDPPHLHHPTDSHLHLSPSSRCPPPSSVVWPFSPFRPHKCRRVYGPFVLLSIHLRPLNRYWLPTCPLPSHTRCLPPPPKKLLHRACPSTTIIFLLLHQSSGLITRSFP